jgi:hypothetical protein
VSKAVIMAGWDDVPHLSEAERARLLAATPPYLRDARSKGIPALGSGAIYPLSIDDITVPPFVIPVHWPRAYGLDVGWKATAGLWGAWDRDSDTIVCFAEYKRGHAEPAVHASAIRARGAKLVGAIDPASRGRSQKDGEKLMDAYTNEEQLTLLKAKNAVEAGLFECWQRFTTGRLKLFASLGQTLAELRLYRRDEHGKVVKENDHLMDALRYLVMTREDIFNWTVPDEGDGDDTRHRRRGDQSWMSA